MSLTEDKDAIFLSLLLHAESPARAPPRAKSLPPAGKKFENEILSLCVYNWQLDSCQKSILCSRRASNGNDPELKGYSKVPKLLGHGTLVLVAYTENYKSETYSTTSVLELYSLIAFNHAYIRITTAEEKM